MIGPQKQFDGLQRAAAEEAAKQALKGLSDKARVNFALELILEVTSIEAAGCVAFAARLIENHAEILMRADFERECG